MMFLAEITVSASPFWEYGTLSSGTAAAGFFFLFLICLGVAVDIGLVLHRIKRPVHLPELADQLAFRALPPRVMMLFSLALVGFYFLASWLYVLLFPGADIEPRTVIFQTLAFHLPVFIALGLLLRFAGIRICELFGIYRKKALALMGLSVIFYLAVFPVLWFCSALYQILLHYLGQDFSLQDVTQVLMASSSWPVRGLLFFITIIVAPVFEEVIFRGILLPFTVRRIGFWPGIILTSLVFGGMHLHLPSFLPLFLLSVSFSLAYARTQSLLVPIGMHAVFNGVTVALLLLMG